MATHFPAIIERRFTDYPRRYSNEYTFDGRTRAVEKFDFRASCATLVGARKAALRALDIYEVGIVRIFDRKTGKYVMTYKRGAGGVITPHAGCVK